MTPEQQRIAIAKECDLDRIAPLRKMKGGWHYLEESHGGADTWARVPLYLTDLNAMHEAEKVLTTTALCDEYNSRLESMMDIGDPSGWKWHATAAQRAEAFLRTLNLWTD